MDILVVMCLGMVIGRLIKGRLIKGINEKIQVGATMLLIFSMGLMLGQKENFLQEVATLGTTSFLFFLVPTVLSIVVVYYLTTRFMRKEKIPSHVTEKE